MLGVTAGNYAVSGGRIRANRRYREKQFDADAVRPP
jgi:hypothetical protein